VIRVSLCLGLGLLLSACSATPLGELNKWVETRQLLGRADSLAEDGDAAGAQQLYRQIIREYPASPLTAQALFQLARLYMTPESPIRDYREAYRYFDQLLIEYPKSPNAAEARAWREALRELLARAQEAARVRQDLERLKKIDKEREQEAARIRQDLERLKRIELELEKKRP